MPVLPPPGRRSLVIAGALVVLGAVTGVCAWLVVSSLSPSAQLIETIVGRIERTTGAHVDLGVVTFDFSAMHVEAGPIEVTGADGSRLLSARAVRFDVAPRRLFSRRITLDDVEIIEPVLSMRVVDGQLTGIVFPEAAVPESFFAVDVRHLHVRDGAVAVTVDTSTAASTAATGATDVVHVGSSVSVVLAGIEGTLLQRGPRDHEARVAVSDARVSRDDHTLLLEPFAGTVWLEGDGVLATEQVAFAEVCIEAPPEALALTASGTVALPFARGTALAKSPLALDIDLTGTTSLDALGVTMRLPLQLGGNVAGAAHVSVRKRAGLTLEGDVEVNDLAVRRMRLGALRTQFHVDAAGLRLTAARWAVGDTVIRGDAHARFEAGAPFEIDARGEGLSLYELFAALGLSSGPWVEARVAGHVVAHGVLDPFTLDGTGQGVLMNITVANSDVARADANRRIIAVARPVRAVTNIHVDRAGLSFTGTLDDDLTRGEGTCVLFFDQRRGLVLDATASHFDTRTIDGRVSVLDVTGTGSGTLHVAGPYAHAVATSMVHALDLRLMGFALGDARGRIDAEGMRLSFDDVVVQKGASHYRGNLALDFTPRPGAKPPRMKLDVALDGALAEDLRAIIPTTAKNAGLVSLRTVDLKGPVTGTIHLEGPLGDGKPDGLAGDGIVISERGAKLFGQNVGGSHMRFHVRGAHVAVDNVGLDLRGIDRSVTRP